MINVELFAKCFVCNHTTHSSIDDVINEVKNFEVGNEENDNTVIDAYCMLQDYLDTIDKK